MPGFSDYTELKILDHVFGGVAWNPPSTYFIALFTVSPNVETGAGGTEVSGGGYARVSVANNTTNFPPAVAGSKSNGSVFTFPTPTSTWGTVVAMGFYDGSGNLIAAQSLITAKTINSGDPVSFPINSITITLD